MKAEETKGIMEKKEETKEKEIELKKDEKKKIEDKEVESKEAVEQKTEEKEKKEPETEKEVTAETKKVEDKAKKKTTAKKTKAINKKDEPKEAEKKVEEKMVEKKEEKKAEDKAVEKKEEKKAENKEVEKKEEKKAEDKALEKKEEKKAEEKETKKKVAKKTTKKATTKKAEEKEAKEKKTTKKATTKKAEEKETKEKKTTKKTATKKAVTKKAEEKEIEDVKVAEENESVDTKAVVVESEVREIAAEEEMTKTVEMEEVKDNPTEQVETIVESEQQEVIYDGPRRSVAFIGSECYPFVKTGGLGDVMYALPRALVKQNCDVKVILPRYECIPQEYQEKMVYKGSFQMDLCRDGHSYYVGIMEYVWDGVVYDFIDNQEFFSGPSAYYNLVDDIPRFCYFGKAALAALNYMDWIPNVIHCHDWQAGLVPLYLRTFFQNTAIGNARVVTTIHNLRFQGIYNIETLKYWSNLPDHLFNKDVMTQNWLDANMLKGGITYSNMITTVSNTYAGEIQSNEYGEGLQEHLRYHSGKLRGIINGIDYDIWNTATDPNLAKNYDITNVLPNKKENKRALQEELGLEQNDDKFVIGLISRLTNQKGLDLVNYIVPQLMDGNTQIVVLGTGDYEYEHSFWWYENEYKGQFAACIQYDEARAHRIYAGADALLVPSRFEPCGLTQLTAMHYGTVPIVRETGGLKDTVEPYNQYSNWGNGFTFDRYDAGLLLDAINRAKTLFFENRWRWDEMVQRDMDKDVSWDNAARQYKDLYLELTW